MKINVVKDTSGKVIASFEGAAGTGAAVTPVLAEGQKAEEVEVPDNYKENLSVLFSAKGK